MIIELGPLPRDGALSWTSETIELLDALADSPLLPFKLPREAYHELRRILEDMRRTAEHERDFRWRCEIDVEHLKPLLTYWVNLGRLSDDTIAASGARWSGDDGERFHGAVLDALLVQLDEVDPEHADRLRRAWRQPALPSRSTSVDAGAEGSPRHR